MRNFNVIVAGGGPAGLAAASAAAAALLETLGHPGGNAVLSMGHLVLVDTPY